MFDQHREDFLDPAPQPSPVTAVAQKQNMRPMLHRITAEIHCVVIRPL